MQIACLIVAYEQGYDMSLLLVLSMVCRLAETADDVPYGWGVESVGRPEFFTQDSVCLHQP